MRDEGPNAPSDGWNRERSRGEARPAPPVQAQPVDRSGRNWGDRPSAGGGTATPAPRQWDRNDRNDRNGSNWNGGDNRGGQNWNGRDNDRRDDWRSRNGRPGTDWQYQRRLQERERWSDMRRWDNGWRNDRRYDWRSYREHNRYLYRMPRYYAPYGWNRGYSRFSIGIFLNSLLFQSSYWIDDPYSYRLPPAYGPLRWIRYYDDALLVDIRDGYVVDVMHDFFW